TAGGSPGCASSLLSPCFAEATLSVFAAAGLSDLAASTDAGEVAGGSGNGGAGFSPTLPLIWAAAAARAAISSAVTSFGNPSGASAPRFTCDSSGCAAGGGTSGACPAAGGAGAGSPALWSTLVRRSLLTAL